MVDIIADSVDIGIDIRGIISHTPPAAINAALDQVLSVGSIDLSTFVTGEWSNKSIIADPIIVTLSIHNDEELAGEFFSSDASIDITISVNQAALYNLSPEESMIKWSNIGVADFTIWKDNIAGERSLDWKGAVYAIKKLGNKAVAYGENGVSMLIPSGNTYGLQTIYRIGLKGKDAVAGDNSVHFFVDSAGQLFFLGENKMKAAMFESIDSPELLGYAEYLSEMSDPVLSWDEKNYLLYICDGTLGYVYSPKSKSLGKGPANITGLGWQGGLLYVAAPAAVVIPPFEICTDIYDFGTHKYKTINTVEIGTNVVGTLQVAIDYRANYTADFTTTPWKDVATSGRCLITALGRELRFRAKVATYEYLEIDYITVKGIIHDH